MIKEDLVKEIVFVTTNPGKIAYANELLHNTTVIPYEYELIEPREDDIRIIAEAKVKQAYDKTQKPCIAMDIGFYITSLNGFPRAYVNHALDTIGVAGLMKLMEGVDDRSCEFRECLAYYDGENVRVFESTSRARLSTTIRGSEKDNKMSNLWYIVEPLGLNKTLAELNDEELKSHISSGTDSSLSKFGKWFERTL